MKALQTFKKQGGKTMKILSDLYYTKDHEWVKVEGDFATIGITDYAQHQLGDIVYVELPEIDDSIDAEENLSTIESVKAASDVLMPVTGTIVEVNEALEDDPALINENAYENWIVKVKMADTSELDQLLSPKAYESLTDEEE